MDQKVKACVIVLSSTICVAALIVFFVAIINKTRLDKYPESDQIKTVQNSYIFLKSCSKCDTWFYLSVLWRIVEYLGVILPFELNAAILYLECFSNTAKQSAIIVFSVLSMSLIIMLYTIHPNEQAKGYRSAYVYLDNAINLYVTTEERKEQTLIDALNVGESFISDGYDNVPTYNKSEESS